MRKFLKAMQLGAIVIAWFEQAREDGQITHQEITDLLDLLATAGGWDGDVKVPPK